MGSAATDSLFLGIDVGSTTAKAVVVDASGALLAHGIRRHRGQLHEAVAELLDELGGLGEFRARGVTGSVGVSLAQELGATPVHELEAAVAVVRRRHPGMGSVVELGGQDAKLVFLAEDPASDDMQMNDRCAAGTGATLDRVIGRLGLTSDWLASLTLTGALEVAAKCGVFAETDVVNLLERGASREHAVSALARAIVLQNLAVLARGRVPRPPVLLLGGPHAHLPVLARAWREALMELWRRRDIEPGPVSVPPDAQLYPAIGAALNAAQGRKAHALTLGVLPRREPLEGLLDSVEASQQLETLRDALRPRGGLASASGPLHLGIDAGSTTVKAALVDESGALVASAYGVSSGDPWQDTRARLGELQTWARAEGVTLSIASAGVTGYGAHFIEQALGADAAPVETVAHLLSALAVDPEVDVVVDVGGTDVKVLEVQTGYVRDFHISNQCSAGLGSFLAASAQDLGIPMEDFGERALAASRAARFGVGCAVFMDTDRVTFRRDGFDSDEILAGLAWSIPRNIWQFVMPTPLAQLGRRFLLTGGAHRNLAVALAQSRYLSARGKQVLLHPHPELAGAIGAALAGARERRGRATRFRGLAHVAQAKMRSRRGPETRCERCELSCQRTFLDLEGAPQTLVVGHTCERGASVEGAPTRSRAHAADLVSLEARLLFRRLLPNPEDTPILRDCPTIGVPRVMALYRSAPLLLHYLRALGVPEEKLLLSPPTSPELFHGGQRFGANDPCFPAKLVLSHVDWLLKRPEVSTLFMPSISHATIAVRGSADTASCPVVAATPYTTAAALRCETGELPGGVRRIAPTLGLLDAEGLEAELFAAFGALLGVTRAQNRRAVDHGRAAQARFHAELRRQGSRVIARAQRDGVAVAVMLMRPYHADPGVCHGVPTALAARGVPVIGIPALPLGDEAELSLEGEEARTTNSGCAEKLWAARRVAKTKGLVAVELGSFRCGQDASILGALSDILGGADKPTLRLHDLDEDRPVASLDVRLDTFVDALRSYERRALEGEDDLPLAPQAMAQP